MIAWPDTAIVLVVMYVLKDLWIFIITTLVTGQHSRHMSGQLLPSQTVFSLHLFCARGNPKPSLDIINTVFYIIIFCTASTESLMPCIFINIALNFLYRSAVSVQVEENWNVCCMQKPWVLLRGWCSYLSIFIHTLGNARLRINMPVGPTL